MRLPAWQSRLFGLCQHYGMPIPWIPRDLWPAMVSDDGAEATFGRVWCTELHETFADDLDDALGALPQAAWDGQLAAFGVNLPRNGRGRPTADLLLSGPHLYLEARLPVRDRPDDLARLRRTLIDTSRTALAMWRAPGPRHALVLRAEGLAHGPLERGLPDHDWFEDHELDSEGWRELVAGLADPRSA